VIEAWSVARVASVLGRSEYSVRSLLRGGCIEGGQRVGRSWVVLVEDGQVRYVARPVGRPEGWQAWMAFSARDRALMLPVALREREAGLGWHRVARAVSRRLAGRLSVDRAVSAGVVRWLVTQAGDPQASWSAEQRSDCRRRRAVAAGKRSAFVRRLRVRRAQ
jgi:hypothetical protein